MVVRESEQKVPGQVSTASMSQDDGMMISVEGTVEFSSQLLEVPHPPGL